MKNANPTKLVVLWLTGILLPAFIVGCNNSSTPLNEDDISLSSTPLNEDDISLNDKESIKPIIYEEVKNNTSGYASLSNDELISFYRLSSKLPEKYLFLHENYKIEFSIDSASSIDEANANSKERVHDERYATSKNIPTSSEVKYEGDTYYVTNISWNHITKEKTSSYNVDAICFKSQYVDFVAPVSFKDKQFSMFIKDFTKAQEIIDLYEYTKDARTASYKLISSSIQEESDKYVYQYYYFDGVGGDWDMKDELRLHLRKYEISKTSGKAIPLEPELLNSAEDYNILFL